MSTERDNGGARGGSAEVAASLTQIASVLASAASPEDVVALLARVLDTLPVGVAVLAADGDFTFLYCNPVFERWPAPEMLPVVGRPFADAFPRIVQNRVIEVLREVVATGRPRHFRNYPYSGYRGTGPTLPGDVTMWNWDLYPLLDEQGRVSHLISTGVDVTESAVARQRLEQAHHRGLEAIVEVSRLVATTADLPTFFGRLSRTVAELVDARAAMFLHLTAGGELVGQPEAYGFESADVERVRVPCVPGGTGLAERIVFEDAVFRARLDGDVPELRPYREVIELLQVRSAAVVAWRAGDDPVGALVAVDSVADDDFSEEDLWVLRAAAHAAGLVWQQKLGQARLQDMVARLSALMRVNLTLTQESDPTAVLSALLEAARELAGAQYAALEVLTPDGTGHDTFLHAGIPQRVVEEIGSLPTGKGVLGAVVKARRPVRLRSIADHPDSVGFPVHHPPMTSFLGVPMVYQDKLIGSLYLTNKLYGAEFTVEDEAIITALAAQAAVSVENARMYQRLAENAATDPLTGLNNRREFERVLSAVPRQPFAVLAIDVDNLKPINDEYGHEAGDAVLRAVADTLQGLRRGGDVLARVGGDEFAALLSGSDLGVALQVAERMRAAMHGVAIGRGQARISIGCAAGRPGEDPARVWSAADDALFRAKRQGRDRVERDRSGASAPLGTQVPVAAHPSQWTDTLGAVLAQRAVRAVYQPILRLTDRAVMGHEALVRPDGYAAESSVEGLFAAAHRLGLVRDLDWLSRRVAIAAARELPRGLPVFVNVSAAALLDPVHGVDQMLLLLRWGSWEPEDVVLEITERETIHDLGRLRYVLAAYREHGFRIALDDVGEGHSTLEVLATALPEYVKIARSLTMTAERPGSVAAIQAAVAFARSTGTTVIAEGVENAAAAAAMGDLGVELGQGWWLAPPQFPETLAAQRSAGTAGV